MATTTKVHVIFKTHLDIGFTDYAQKVVCTYMKEYLPKAINLAQQMRESQSSDRFIWTSGSWLIYEYLEQADADERKRMEAAILAGDIVWHALPFTTHSELMDTSLFRFGLSLSQKLDQRFGKKTIAAKMTDVPGHTKGIAPLLAEAGVQFLHIGVNSASTPPDVPPVFVWQATDNTNLIVMYHKGSYGTTMTIPDFPEAISFAHTGDNHGPQSTDKIVDTYTRLREQFPGATVNAATMDDFARSLLLHKDQLPIVTGEIGDTWCHGIGTDPWKVAQFRALCRLRTAWLDTGRVREDDPAVDAFSRLLLMIPEHTWGMDIKKHLADYTNYTPEQLRINLDLPNFQRFSCSWQEQRNYIKTAIKALGQTELANEADAEIAKLTPQKVSVPRHIASPTQRFAAGYFDIGFDPETGAINHLLEKETNRIWATPEHPLSTIWLENFSQADYDRFISQYLINLDKNRDWSIPDFSKPGIDRYVKEHQVFHPKFTRFSYVKTDCQHRFFLQLTTPATGVRYFGLPPEWTICLTTDIRTPEIQITVQWAGMSACRLPVAFWLSFSPSTKIEGQWSMDKLGLQISPLDVVSKGAMHLHAVGTGVNYQDAEGGLQITTLDAPLVAPGAPSLLNFDNSLPDLSGGMHFNLYNNIWGTNFPMWYEDDGMFRFVLRTAHTPRKLHGIGEKAED